MTEGAAEFEIEDLRHDGAAPASPRAARVWAAALVVALVAFGAAALTLSDYGLVWDEPYYFTWQEHQRNWFRILLDRPGEALTASGIAKGWGFDPYHNPHPPLYKTVSNATWVLAHRFLDPFVALRLAGPIWFALLAAGLVLLSVEAGLGGPRTGVIAAAFLGTLPRVFAHAHFVATDVPIAALSVLATLAFVRSRRGGWAAPVSFGVLAGMAIATKFSGCLIPVPLAAWSLAGRKRWAWRPLAAGAILAPIVAVALNAAWWHDPIRSLVEHVLVSMSREHHTPVSLAYFGRLYPFHGPWHAPWAMLALTVPLSTLALALLGLAGVARRRFRHEGERLILACFLVPMLVLALPNAPHHDGIRMFLPALPFLCVFSARGFESLRASLARRVVPLARGRGVRNARAKLGYALATLALGPAGIALVAYHPHELSYYNALLGGLRGAHASGMEITYWMEIFSPPVLDEMMAALPPGAAVNPVSADPGYFRFLQKHGRLRKDVTFGTTDDPGAYSLVLARVGSLGERDLALAQALPHAYEYRFRGVPFVILIPPRGEAP